MLKNILCLILFIAEIQILNVLGLNLEVAAGSVKYIAAIFIVSSILFLIIINFVPVVSLPSFKKEDEKVSFFNRWSGFILLIAAGIVCLCSFFSVTAFTKIVPAFFYILNIAVCTFILTINRLIPTIKFAAHVITMAQKDPQGTALYLAAHPDVIDTVVGALPGGFILSFYTGPIKERLSNLKNSAAQNK